MAHLISYDELDLGDLARHIVRGRLDSRRINAATTARLAACEPAELLAPGLASHARGLMSLAGGRIALLEAVVHHQDIRRALGRPRNVPPERLIVAPRSSLLAPDVGSFWRVRNVRLVATDLDFSWGLGPEVCGTGEALLMTVAGRPAAVAELNGPGLSSWAMSAALDIVRLYCPVMARYTIDAPTLLHLVANDLVCDPAHQLVAPNLIRSQALSLLLVSVTSGDMTEHTALAYHQRLTEMKMRLLGDRVSRGTAWKLAREHGWSTFDAEYIAVCTLQADAFISIDPAMVAKAGLIVPIAQLDDLIAI